MCRFVSRVTLALVPVPTSAEPSLSCFARAVVEYTTLSPGSANPISIAWCLRGVHLQSTSPTRWVGKMNAPLEPKFLNLATGPAHARGSSVAGAPPVGGALDSAHSRKTHSLSGTSN